MAKIRLADHADMLNRVENHDHFIDGIRFSRQHGVDNDGIWPLDSGIEAAISIGQESVGSYFLGRLYGRGYFDEEINSWNSTKPTTMSAR